MVDVPFRISNPHLLINKHILWPATLSLRELQATIFKLIFYTTQLGIDKFHNYGIIYNILFKISFQK